MKKVMIIGAGPGGLTAGMLLARRGFDVSIYEKEPMVGGRNAFLELDGFKHDIGPTFLMMKFVLDEVFEEAGKKVDEYLEFTRLDPMYRLQFRDVTVEPSPDPDKMRRTIDRLFPGESAGYDAFMRGEGRRFDLMLPCLQKEYSGLSTFLHPDFLKALPRLSLGRSMYGQLGKYFRNERLKISFTFQSKYLGMSPWECPAAFTIIPYIEHAWGVYHTKGGLSAISQAMARAAAENGAKILTGMKAERVILNGKKAVGAEFADGRKEYADEVVLNADFGYAMSKLMPPGSVVKWSRENLMRRQFSCSTFMLYLNLDKVYDLPHHTILFSEDYKSFIERVTHGPGLPDDLSIYVRNASVTDPTLAPKGASGLYVLVPVRNNMSGVDWEKEKGPFRDKVLRTIAARTGISDLERHIVGEKVLTPADWENGMNVFLGATFNLAHNLGQMLYFRPRNKFEELDNCWLVGGGTHPGSGLPTIYESGRITANMISRRHGVRFVTRNLQVS